MLDYAVEVTFQEMLTEAHQRLALWKLPDLVVENFNCGLVYGSSGGKQIVPNPKAAMAIAEFERKYGYIVYYILENDYGPELGKMRTFLFVSDAGSEWTGDRRDIQAGSVIAYVQNITHPLLSEFGSVGIRLNPERGILERTY